MTKWRLLAQTIDGGALTLHDLLDLAMALGVLNATPSEAAMALDYLCLFVSSKC
jgi:hypothetical protein